MAHVWKTSHVRKSSKVPLELNATVASPKSGIAFVDALAVEEAEVVESVA
jgi:hypothetical protein